MNNKSIKSKVIMTINNKKILKINNLVLIMHLLN